MRNITKFENESLYEAHMGGGDSVLPNVSWVKDINEVKYGRKVKRIATFNVSTEEYLNTNPILLYNCSGVKNIKVNGVLTGPDENNQIAVTEVGTYEVEMEFESNEINIDLFNKDTDGSWGGFNTLSELNNDFFVGIKNIPILQTPFIRTINIPDSVIFINDGAFKSCESLTSVTIGNGVTSIGYNAFNNCSSLTSVNISSLESWVNINFNDYHANPLYWARNLYLNGQLVTDLVIPNSITSIGENAFLNCESLTSINIPDSVTSIGLNAFSGCSNLTSVNISSLESWVNINFNDYHANPLYYAKNLYLNNELITDLVIPNSVTSIGNFAFHGCSNLTSINIPNSVTSIDYGTFSGCSGLTSINIPDSVTSIGENAFSSCSNLTSINIPNSVTSIDYGTFSGCSGLTSINIPDSVTSIGNMAFENCSNLTSINIPDNVTSIGNWAFKNCTSLSEITCYALTAPTIKSSTFQSVKTDGVLKVPTGATGYDTQWMKTSNYYLGKYNWSIEYI